jgi:hypothetical protein
MFSFLQMALLRPLNMNNFAPNILILFQAIEWVNGSEKKFSQEVAADSVSL